MPLSFSKNERLYEFRLIKLLFASGNSFSIPPFKVRWMKLEAGADSAFQSMISIPKTIHSKSSDRNLIRRRIRESVRLNKSILTDDIRQAQPKPAFCIIYTAKEILSYSTIQDKIILLLRRLKEECEKDN